jgi:uncharacterized membrane protein YtjA (UPF0391 family)
LSARDDLVPAKSLEKLAQGNSPGPRGVLQQTFGQPRTSAFGKRSKHMNLLHWAVIFLVVAIVAAALGFGGVAGTAMEGARIFVWVFLVLFIVSLVVGLLRRG